MKIKSFLHVIRHNSFTKLSAIRLIGVFICTLTWSVSIQAGHGPLCRNVTGPRRVVDPRYFKNIQWRDPSLPDLGIFEFRELSYDFRTGETKELTKHAFDPNDFTPDKLPPPKLIHSTNRQYYLYTDPETGERYSRTQYYSFTRAESQSPFEIDDTTVFYGDDPTYTSFTKTFDPKIVPTPTETEIQESDYRLKRSETFGLSNVSYRNFPEVTLAGLVTETRYEATPLHVELYGLPGYTIRGTTYNKAVRLQNYRSGSIINRIYDVVPARGEFAPGFARRIYHRIPYKFRNDFLTLIRKNREGTIYGTEKALQNIFSLINLHEDEIDRINRKILKEGFTRQKQFVKEILDFIIPLYRERRGWDEKKISDFEQNAYKTMDNTRYIRIENKKGEIGAALGLTTVHYGKVKFFDKRSQQWIELMGPYGSAHAIAQGWGAPFGKMPFPIYWNAPVDILPIETEGFLLPRPTVAEDSPGFDTEELQMRLRHVWPMKDKWGYDPDLNKPIIFSTGRLIEPVKFGVSKDLKDLGLSNVEVLTQMLLAVFPDEFSPKFNNEGQLLVTYNTPEGARMYKRLGFEPIPGVPSKMMNGEEWIALSATPQSVVNAVHKIRYMKSDEAEKILNALSKRF